MKTNLELFGVECSRGWDNLIRPLWEQCKKEGVEVFQIKEKFGTLRFYTSSCSDELLKAIDAAEEKSAFICEYCGSPGKLRGHSWFYTACNEHAREGDKDES